MTMGDGSKASAGAVSSPQSGRWHVAWMFPLIWVACWVGKTQLMGLAVISPLLGLGLKMLGVSGPASAFLAYLKLSTAVALITVLPLLTRLALGRRKLPAGFIGISYVVVLLGVMSVHFFLAPMFMRWLVPPTSSLAPATLSFDSLTDLLLRLYVTQTAAAQLTVVSATGALPPLPRSWDSAAIRWLVRGLGAMLVAAIMTPPDPTSFFIVLLTWVAFWWTATLARRFLVTSGPSATDEPAADLVSDSENPNPYKPPAGG